MSIRKGNTIIAGNIDAVYETDEQTITINQNEKLQVIGTINKNTLAPKYDWVGTKAEYDALENKNEDWLYFVTDDEKETVTLANCVGQIIQAVCTSSYIPNGCIPCDGTEYTADRFLDFWTNYLTCQPAKILTCTYNEYNTEINTYGQCAKFAVDTSAGKFKAPTIKDGSVIQQAMNDSELGKSYNAGLPNITGALCPQVSTFTAKSATGAFRTAGDSNLYDGSYLQSQLSQYGYTFDASRSSSIYGNSSTVQPNAVSLRYFVVVVDTYLNQSQLDWTTYTQSLNNKADKNLVNTGYLTNCITEIPQNIKLELNNGVLTLKAGSVVYIPNGFESNNTTPKFKEKVLQTDTTLAFGSNTNGTFMICIQDNNYDAFDYVELSRTYSGTTNPAATYSYWYDTGTNLNKLFLDNTTTPSRNESLPIAIITVSNSAITSIDQVFNGFGYMGYTVFALPGVKGLAPAGKSEYGTLLSQPFTVTKVMTHTFGNDYTGPMVLSINGDGFGIDAANYYECPSKPSGEGYCWLDTSTNTLNSSQWNGSGYTYFSDLRYCLFFRGARQANARIYLAEFKQPTKIIDYSSADFVVAYKHPTSIDPTWYRLYRSGWVEQGGKSTSDGQTVTFPIQMSNTEYFISGMPFELDTGAISSVAFASKTTTSVLLYGKRVNAAGFASGAHPVYWEVKGFAAGY